MSLYTHNYFAYTENNIQMTVFTLIITRSALLRITSHRLPLITLCEVREAIRREHFAYKNNTIIYIYVCFLYVCEVFSMHAHARGKKTEKELVP